MFSIKQEMKKLAQKHPFFSSKEAFKNPFKHQLQEKFRVIENKDFRGQLSRCSGYNAPKYRQ
jgi:hypothetical protein